MARPGNGMAPGPEHGIVCLLNDWAGRAVSPQEEKQGKGKRCHSPGHLAAAGAAGVRSEPILPQNPESGLGRGGWPGRPWAFFVGVHSRPFLPSCSHE